MSAHQCSASVRFVGASLLVLLSAAWLGAQETPATENPLAAYYGFKTPEVFKLEQRSSNLLTGDLNNDGLTDLILVDNSHSRLDLLQQRKEKPADAAATPGVEKRVNEIANDWRFEHRKIPVDKQISAMTLGDFNGDGRTDVAYFGVPDRLVFRYQPESGDWTEQTSYRLPDVPVAPWNLAAGDVNNDGRDDLVVLGKSQTYLILQQADKTLATPVGLMNTSDKLGLAQIADLDGDGRKDLCYVAGDDQERAFCARLQDDEGRLGPELQFELDRPRAITLSDVNGKPGNEIVTIESRTGRVKVLQLGRPASKAGELAGRLIQYGFGRQDQGKERDLATGDLDGDGAVDVVVTDPETAQMILFRQRGERGLDLGSTFPGLAGTTQARLADFDGDKSDEILVLSAQEKALGLSKLVAGRLSFPEPLSVEEEPVVLEAADLNGDSRPEIVYISRQRDGRNAKHDLRALQRGENGQWKPYLFGSGKVSNLSLDLPSTPTRLAQLDANGDGRSDFLIFMGTNRAPLLRSTNSDGVPVPVNPQGGIRLGDVSAGQVFIERAEKPLILAAQGNFARSLQLDDKQQWRVIDQYNAAESNAQIVGAAALDLDEKPGREIVLVDAGIRKLRVLRQDGNVFRPWREVDIGAFPYESLRIADLNADGRQDLLLFGRGKFGVLYAGRTDPTLVELASFESKLEKTYFADVVAEDLNADKGVDLAVIDTQSHFIELLNVHPEKGLRHAIHFKLFEEKSFADGERSGTEPRETAVADVTGDGKIDLILLTHDRVLVFPQDDGKAESK
ncbi:MAG: FG-GAP-like repeat-containing protein [Planctomycetaceae bacterium]